MKADAIRRLISYRCKALGLRKGEVAVRAGISREMLYKFETGASDLGVSKLISLLSVLGMRMEVLPDIETLPRNHREQKTAKQLAYLARAGRDSVVGIAHGAKIGAARIPDLGSTW